MFLLPTYQRKGWPRRAGGILYTRTAPCNKKACTIIRVSKKGCIFMSRPRKTCNWLKLFITRLNVLKPVKCIPNTEHYSPTNYCYYYHIEMNPLLRGCVLEHTPFSLQNLSPCSHPLPEVSRGATTGTVSPKVRAQDLHHGLPAGRVGARTCLSVTGGEWRWRA